MTISRSKKSPDKKPHVLQRIEAKLWELGAEDQECCETIQSILAMIKKQLKKTNEGTIFTWGDFGSNVKKLRLKKKMTQAKLAEKLKCKQSYISRIEKGAKWVSIQTLQKLSAIFKVEPNDLFTPTTGS